MKSEDIKREIDLLESVLWHKIKDTGVMESSRMTGLKQPDISEWLSKKRNWTYNKILEIAGKLGL